MAESMMNCKYILGDFLMHFRGITEVLKTISESSSKRSIDFFRVRSYFYLYDFLMKFDSLYKETATDLNKKRIDKIGRLSYHISADLFR